MPGFGRHSREEDRARGSRPGTERRASDNTGSVRAPNRASLFLRASASDYVLVLVVSCALAFTVSYGFYSAPDLRGNVALIAGVQAVLLVALYAGGWSKRAVPIAAVAYVLLAAGAVALLSSMSPAPAELFVDGQVNDVEGNYAVFGIVVVIIPPLVYLLSRRTWGVAVLFLLGVLACGTIQFLYRDWIGMHPGTAATIVVYVGIGALFMMQGYRQGVLRSHVVKRTSFAMAFAYGVLGSLVCVGVGVLVFYGIVSGLGIATVDAKPFEDFFSRPVEEYNGLYSQQPIYDPDLGTSNLSDEIDYTSDDANGTEDESNERNGGGFSIVSAVAETLDVEDWQQSLDSIRVELPPSVRILLYFSPVMLIAIAVFARFVQREQRLNRIECWPYPERVAFLYNFFMDRFKRLKVDKPDTATPIEFALSSSSELAGFTRNASQADLLGVTLIYQRAVYGAKNVGEEEYRYVRDYYRAFFKNAHARMGHPRWMLSGFWRI